RVVVQLFDLILVHHRLDHQIGPVAVNFRRRKVDETKLKTLLQADHVLRADRVRAPQRFVKIFAVPATEFCGAVIDVIEWATAFENALQLTKVADIATRVKRQFDVSTQTKADLVRLMLKIAGDGVMSASPELCDESGPDCAK